MIRPNCLFLRVLLTFNFVVVSLFISACEPPPISALSAEEGISRIRENHSDENWLLVTSEVTEYRSRHPYSKFAAEAELLQADAFFQLGQYPESITTYDSFLMKFPKHEKAPFALFRTAQCLDNQSPEAVDREQQFAEKALETYSNFIERYPDGENRTEAKERISVLRRRLAGHDLFIARFYWKKDQLQSALGRYLQIIERYPMFPEMIVEAKTRGAEAYKRLAGILEENPGSEQYSLFKTESAQSLKDKAQQLQEKGPTEANEK